MSGLAIMLREAGYEVWGLDREESETTEELRKLGMEVSNSLSFRPGDCVVVSDAIDLGTSEVVRRAIDLKLP
ncbi:Mur ligase domain-containing protein, partial [Acinetobacter baumannii]